MATLTWIGDHGPEGFQLSGAIRIGRAPENEIRLRDSAVSSHHARIAPEADGWVIEDSGSTNGTFVNGCRSDRQILHDGDLIQIGSFALTFRIEPDSKGEDATPRPEAKAPRLEHLFRQEAEGADTFRTLIVAPAAEPKEDDDPRILARRLEASYEISKATAATLDLSEILDRVLDALFGIFASADRAFILLADPGSGEVSAAASRGRKPGAADRLGISRTALDRAMARREAVLCEDAMEDVRYAGVRSVQEFSIRSMMIAPLIFQDRVLGAIYVDTQRLAGQFVEADLKLLAAAGAQVAGCVTNARLHEELVAKERLAAVGQTVAGLAHCVKNVLQSVKGGTYIVDKGFREAKQETVDRGWRMVKRGNTLLEEIVMDLLSYSKERVPQREPTDLNHLCEEVCELASERAKARGVSIAVEPDPTIGSIDVDPMAIRRSLLNLVGNAVDACAGGGAVTVRTRAGGEEESVRILVEDNGCGMSAETKAKLFTMFFSTKGGKGTGLGLPVVQKIIREHGGGIELESEVGRGTTFTVLLPRRPPETREPDGAIT